MEIIEEIKEKKRVVIINKNDLPLKISLEDVKKNLQEDPIVSISALKTKA